LGYGAITNDEEKYKGIIMAEKKEVIYEGKRGNSRIASASGFFFNDFGGGLQVNWSAENCGFGGFTIGFDKERGTTCVDSEMMSPEFVAKVMEKLIYESLFTDFHTATKEIIAASLDEVNNVFPFRSNVLYLPFYEQEDKNNPDLYEMRWHLPEDKVLNVWFDKKIVGENPDDAFLFAHTLSKDKSFAKGFVKAEIWSWTITEKK
jgi:hypothetical protein